MEVEHKTVHIPESTPANLSVVVETKAAKFKRVGEIRINNTLGEMRKLRNLSRRQDYDFTPEQVDTIIGTLKEEIKKIEAAFADEVVTEGRISL